MRQQLKLPDVSKTCNFKMKREESDATDRQGVDRLYNQKSPVPMTNSQVANSAPSVSAGRNQCFLEEGGYGKILKPREVQNFHLVSY